MGRSVVLRRVGSAWGPRGGDGGPGHLRLGDPQGLQIWFGEGQKDGSFFPMVDHAAGSDWTIAVWTYGRLDVHFQHLAKEHEYSTKLPGPRRLVVSRVLPSPEGQAVIADAPNFLDMSRFQFLVVEEGGGHPSPDTHSAAR